MCEEELLSLFETSFRIHKNRAGASAAQVQFSGPAPSASTALALELCCHMGSQRRNCTLLNQLCLKNNWTHMVLPHLFFTVSFTNPSCGHAWSQASCSHLQHELLLLLPPQVTAHRHPTGTLTVPAPGGPGPQLTAQSSA